MNDKQELVKKVEQLLHLLLIVGSDCGQRVSKLCELRSFHQELQKTLDERQEQLCSKLGLDVFEIVESLMKGLIPSHEVVHDSDIGGAIRKAVDCGYQFELKAPREN